LLRHQLGLKTPDPNVVGVVELDETVFILEEFYFHSHDIDVVDELNEIANLVARLQAVSSWIGPHQCSLLPFELLVIVMDASEKPRREVSVEGSLVFGWEASDSALFEADWTESELEEAAEANLVQRG
jgi:hypothetical protein